MSTPQHFKLDLDAFVKRTGVDINTTRKKVVLDLFGKIVGRTPVDTGRLRANWAVADGSPPTEQLSVEPGGRKAPIDGASALGDAAGSVAYGNVSLGHSADTIAWITNALPYATRVEYGYSKQAPSGMVRLSVAEIKSELESTRG